MTDLALSRLRRGIALAGAGLVVQLGTAFFWSPGAFILSAAIGLPLVLVGATISFRAINTKSANTDAATVRAL